MIKKGVFKSKEAIVENAWSHSIVAGMGAYLLARYGKQIRTLSCIFMVTEGLTEFKLRWRLLGTCLVFRFGQVSSSELARTEV